MTLKSLDSNLATTKQVTANSMQLYSYYRSSASYRVRIALNIKNIPFDTHAIHLASNGGDNYSDEFLALNPQGFVPALKNNNQIITQSLAIIEYLEENYPTPTLLPDNINDRALSRALAQIVCTDIHPINNLRILDYLRNELACDKKTINKWYCHWITEGLIAIEKLLEKRNVSTVYCYGDTPSIADICLIPQLYNAKRFHCNLTNFPIINEIVLNCNNLESFIKSVPENQSDYES